MAKKKRYKRKNRGYEDETFCLHPYIDNEPEKYYYDRLKKLESAGNNAYSGEF